MSFKNIILNSKDSINDILSELDLCLYEINLTKEFDSDVVQILVINKDPKNRLIDFDNLVKANELISAYFDKVDDTDFKYLLEVSSAGAERQIKSEELLFESLNLYMYVKLFTSKDGIKEFNGILIDNKDKIYTFTINLKGRIKKIKLKWDEIEFIRFAIKF
ncbi:hypothetical protein [Spiroplasma turonicum]|uniref:Ribosome maturation factor RimP n=1 Tax=Spiroplasma turonicum TaxID=216946 RepID=A0A0K1P5F7_9MOLU|nr:hypothetical protein [Spiroplasma turonicum]AKU79513.1 ribosome maturation factor RimP [Spiroplasma turonicum]ALX70536.1 ribosome maturation factor RimP [Spiroplasma turonicum]